jgi:hypothetical protein
LENLDLFRVSDFEFRISDFGLLEGDQVAADLIRRWICLPSSSSLSEKDRWFVGSAFLARKFGAKNATMDI